jgi:hypothetical protein
VLLYKRKVQALAMKNLAAVWVNFQAAGAERLILADVLEARDDLERYRAAVPGAEMLMVRLQASLGALERRLAQREMGAGFDRHLRRAAELVAQMERTGSRICWWIRKTKSSQPLHGKC